MQYYAYVYYVPNGLSGNIGHALLGNGCPNGIPVIQDPSSLRLYRANFNAEPPAMLPYFGEENSSSFLNSR